MERMFYIQLSLFWDTMASLAHVLGSDGSTWHLLANIGSPSRSSLNLKRKINLRGENNCTIMIDRKMFSLTTCNLWGSFISIMHNSLSFRLRASYPGKILEKSSRFLNFYYLFICTCISISMFKIHNNTLWINSCRS